MTPEEIWDTLPVELIAGLIVALITFLLYAAGRMLWTAVRRVARFVAVRAKLRAIDREIARTRTKGRWVRPVSAADRALQRRIADSIPVLLVANQKGGVGKTTLALNLGAYFALKHRKRVLFIDLDFQGTMSATLRYMAGSDARDEPPTGHRILLIDRTQFRGRDKGIARRDTDATVLGLRRALPADNVQGLPGDMSTCSFFDVGENFADVEDWLMMKWVTRRDPVDVRFQLARFLHSAEVQSAFDVVILDAPPRDTTGGVNGFCACTHVLVPTRADRFSWQGARRFLLSTSRTHDLLAPNAKLLGVVGMMTPAQVAEGVAPAPLDAMIAELAAQTITSSETRAKKPILAHWPAGSTFEYFGTIPTGVAFAGDSGERISYGSAANVRTFVNHIGDPVAKRLWPAGA